MLICGCESVDSKGRIVSVWQYGSAKNPRGCAEFYMDEQVVYTAYVELGGYMIPARAPISGFKPRIIRVFAPPGSRNFRIAPISDKNSLHDYIIEIKEQMITPVRIHTQISSESLRGNVLTREWDTTVTSEDTIPMDGKFDQMGYEKNPTESPKPLILGKPLW
jgi:hypothetical protein